MNEGCDIKGYENRFGQYISELLRIYMTKQDKDQEIILCYLFPKLYSLLVSSLLEKNITFMLDEVLASLFKTSNKKQLSTSMEIV